MASVISSLFARSSGGPALQAPAQSAAVADAGVSAPLTENSSASSTNETKPSTPLNPAVASQTSVNKNRIRDSGSDEEYHHAGPDTRRPESSMQALKNKFESDLSQLSIRTFGDNVYVPTPSLQQEIAHTNRIDNISNTAINTPTISGGTISNTSFSGGTISGATITDSNLGGSTLTSLWGAYRFRICNLDIFRWHLRVEPRDNRDLDLGGCHCKFRWPQHRHLETARVLPIAAS